MQQVPRSENVVRVHAVARRLELEQDDLEPELVRLVGDDEQELVMLLAEPLLQGQELRHFEIRAVGKLASFLSEASRHPVNA